MDQIWLKLIEQAPNTAVNLMIVWFFLNYMKHRDADNARLLKEIGDSCHLFQSQASAESNNALLKNSMALDRNSEALGYSARKWPKQQ